MCRDDKGSEGWSEEGSMNSCRRREVVVLRDINRIQNITSTLVMITLTGQIPECTEPQPRRRDRKGRTPQRTKAPARLRHTENRARRGMKQKLNKKPQTPERKTSKISKVIFFITNVTVSVIKKR